MSTEWYRMIQNGTVLSAIKARLVMYFVHFYMQVLGLTMGQEKH